jgi:cobalt-zinc-cadmium efflux system protein
VRGAFLHVLGDAIGSVGAIFAALIILRTGWTLADPLVSILIAGIILFTSWGLIRESVDILMQSVPEGISLNEVQKAMESVKGILKVHDLHIWAVTSGVFTLSAHAVVIEDGNTREVLTETEKILNGKFNIRHTTIQLETESREAEEFEAF